jgi:hypothetical protein
VGGAEEVVAGVFWVPSKLVVVENQAEVVKVEDVVACWRQYKVVEMVVVEEEEMLVAVAVCWLQSKDVEEAEEEV